MNRKKLTDLSVRQAKPAKPGTRYEIHDSERPGLALRVGPARKTFVVYRRAKGSKVPSRLRVGTYPEMSLEAARRKAGEMIDLLAKGQHPREVEEREQLEQERVRLETFRAVVDEYLEKYARPNLRSAGRDEAMFDTYAMPKWGALPIRSIARRDVVRLIDEIAKTKPVMANRVLGRLQVLFKWARSRDLLDVVPTEGVEKPTVERSRDRVLNDYELAAVWHAAGELGYPWAQLIKMAILCGQRISETAGMEWSEIDAGQAVWSIPKEKTKSDRAHVVPLSTAAQGVLATAPRVTKFVFCTRRSRKVEEGQPVRWQDVPAVPGSKCKATLDARIEQWIEKQAAKEPAGYWGQWAGERRKLGQPLGLDPWVIHDLRRSLASGCARLKADPRIVGMILNHAAEAVTGATAVYVRHGFTDEKRAVLETWGRHVTALVTGKPAENVVELRQAAG